MSALICQTGRDPGEGSTLGYAESHTPHASHRSNTRRRLEGQGRCDALRLKESPWGTELRELSWCSFCHHSVTPPPPHLPFPSSNLTPPLSGVRATPPRPRRSLSPPHPPTDNRCIDSLNLITTSHYLQYNTHSRCSSPPLSSPRRSVAVSLTSTVASHHRLVVGTLRISSVLGLPPPPRLLPTLFPLALFLSFSLLSCFLRWVDVAAVPISPPRSRPVVVLRGTNPRRWSRR